jgi:hypothetical protein
MNTRLCRTPALRVSCPIILTRGVTKPPLQGGWDNPFLVFQDWSSKLVGQQQRSLLSESYSVHLGQGHLLIGIVPTPLFQG